MRYEFENRKNPLYMRKVQKLEPLPHIHPQIELIYLTKGSSIAYADGKSFSLEQGEFFFAFPNQIHFFHDRSATEAYLFILAPDYVKDLEDIFLTQVPASPIIKPEDTPSNMESRLETILHKNTSKMPLDNIIGKSYLIALLAELLSKTILMDAPADYDSVKNLLIYCAEHYKEPLSLDKLSQELHLSKSYISYIFSQKLQVSFTDFINNLRVEYACTQLKKGTNITELALASGFSSVRTFNRAFMQQMNITPRDYIKQKYSAYLSSGIIGYN